MNITVITNPATRIKNIILDTRQPALATPRKPKIPAIIERTINIIAIVSNTQNIMKKYYNFLKVIKRAKSIKTANFYFQYKIRC